MVESGCDTTITIDRLIGGTIVGHDVAKYTSGVGAVFIGEKEKQIIHQRSCYTTVGEARR